MPSEDFEKFNSLQFCENVKKSALEGAMVQKSMKNKAGTAATDFFYFLSEFNINNPLNNFLFLTKTSTMEYFLDFLL